jgi:hypothetical protein
MRWLANVLAALLLIQSAWAGSTINNLGAASTLNGQEQFPVFQGANPAVKTTTQALATMATNYVDPILSENAAGIITTTTGSITASSKTLTVASATGWSIGMGIAVANAGTGGNTELITSVTNISGTTFTLNDAAITTATTQTVNHDDTAAIAAAIATGKPVHLRTGNYNVTSGFTISSPTTFVGDGGGLSIIWNRNPTGTVFTISYTSQVAATACFTGWFSGWTGCYQGKAALFQDFQISQANGMTATDGYGFSVAGTSGNGVTNLHINRIVMNNLWGGIFLGSFLISNWFTDNYIQGTQGGWGIVINTPTPYGDSNLVGNELNGQNTGLKIIASDTSMIVNLKTNGSGILFAGSPSTIQRVRIINPSIEAFNSAPTCGIDFGSSGTRQTQVIGGGIGLMSTPLCNADQGESTSVVGTDLYPGNSTDGQKMIIPNMVIAALLSVSNGELGMGKITASGVAPGAPGAKLAIVCGTNAGSAKLIAYAGTSTTPTTVVDNIGSGVSGC